MEVNPKLTEKAQKDYLLIRDALENDNQLAYRQLMLSYRDTIYFMMLRFAGTPEDAEDLTLESFSKAFKNLQQYTPDFAFSTWLFRIATNHAIDHVRSKGRNVLNLQIKEELLSSESTGMLPAIEDNPEETLFKHQRVKIMRDLVEVLKPRYRKLVELRYFEEYSYEEIGAQLNLPIGTVKAQLFRAREFLHNVLKDKKNKF